MPRGPRREPELDPVARQPVQGKPFQMQLFMGARELQGASTRSVDAPAGHMFPMWSRKSMEAQEPASRGTHGAGIYDSMKEHGYDASQHKTFDPGPTLMFDDEGGFTQGEGHHRIVAGAKIERESRLTGGEEGPIKPRDVWMPVNYTNPPTKRKPRFDDNDESVM